MPGTTADQHENRLKPAETGAANQRWWRLRWRRWRRWRLRAGSPFGAALAPLPSWNVITAVLQRRRRHRCRRRRRPVRMDQVERVRTA